jgi:hypothetical protein
MISQTYDEMRGVGEIRTSAFNLFKQGGFFSSKVYLNIGFAVVLGEKSKTGWFIFDAKMNEWTLLEVREFIALIDGHRYINEGQIRKSDTNVEGYDVMCYEEMHVPFDMDLLNRMASATTIKIRVGGTDFVLAPDVMAELKALNEAVAAVN